MLVECPKCNTCVMPMANGKCPQCSAPIDKTTARSAEMPAEEALRIVQNIDNEHQRALSAALSTARATRKQYLMRACLVEIAFSLIVAFMFGLGRHWTALLDKDTPAGELVLILIFGVSRAIGIFLSCKADAAVGRNGVAGVLAVIGLPGMLLVGLLQPGRINEPAKGTQRSKQAQSMF